MRVSTTLVRTCAIFTILLSFVTGKKTSPPYQPTSDKTCSSQETEYFRDDANLCCSKCHPGTRLKTECNSTSDTECEPCPKSQYTEHSNYFPKCFSCTKCQEKKGLQYAQICSSTISSKCKCRSEMYCRLGYAAPYCTSDCQRYTLCEPGFGISQKRAGDANVKCVPCGDGTFSDKRSYEQLCEPHTDCLSQGTAVVSKGNATSDNVCGPLPSSLLAVPESTTMRTTDHSLLTTTVSPSLSFFPTNTTVHPAQLSNQLSDSNWTVVFYAIGVVGLLVLILVMVLLIKCKVKQTEVTNVNYEEKIIEIACEGPGKAQLAFSNNIQEEQCLLGAGEPCRTDSQCNGVTDTFSGSEGFNSLESQTIDPPQSTPPQSTLPQSTLPQSTIPSLGLQSSKSNPMLKSTSMEPGSTNNLTHPNSQPNSPQVNVSIIFNMGNGHCAIVPTDSAQKSPELLKRKEECFSVPQQEDGKRPLVAVQESCDHV